MDDTRVGSMAANPRGRRDLVGAGFGEAAATGAGAVSAAAPWHSENFLPEAQGQGSFFRMFIELQYTEISPGEMYGFLRPMFDERKVRFVKELAKFLVEDQASKSILLEIGNLAAKGWAALRGTTPLMGYPTVQEAERQLADWLDIQLEPPIQLLVTGAPSPNRDSRAT